MNSSHGFTAKNVTVSKEKMVEKRAVFADASLEVSDEVVRYQCVTKVSLPEAIMHVSFSGMEADIAEVRTPSC